MDTFEAVIAIVTVTAVVLGFVRITWDRATGQRAKRDQSYKDVAQLKKWVIPDPTNKRESLVEMVIDNKEKLDDFSKRLEDHAQELESMNVRLRQHLTDEEQKLDKINRKIDSRPFWRIW